jgi:hypothetical protein
MQISKRLVIGFLACGLVPTLTSTLLSNRFSSAALRDMEFLGRDSAVEGMSSDLEGFEDEISKARESAARTKTSGEEMDGLASELQTLVDQFRVQ